ncbi:hypothetical protein HYU23_00220 [Candidatus Woesearchaeota archaeon]|nr:hypothetical protein [Candidatus Woesearchaeota archaeon]
MQEKIRNRCYYVLKGLFKEIFEYELPLNEPQYEEVISLIVTLLDSGELDPITDKLLLIKFKTFLSYGRKWEEVYSKIFSNPEKYKTLLNEIIILLGSVKKEEVDLGGFSFDVDLESDLKFFKILVPGFQNGINYNMRELTVSKYDKVIKIRRVKQGDPRVYLHNPLREEIVFVKKHLLKERFPNCLLPFIKKYKLKLYLCPVDKMISFIANKYSQNGVLNLVAVSKKSYAKYLDDRTMFIVFGRDEDKYVPVEFAYAGIDSRVPLIFMQTFAFAAGINPDEIQILDFGETGKLVDDKYYKTMDPNSIALVGWWDELLQKTIELYFHQNFRLILNDFIFTVLNFMSEKGFRTYETRRAISIGQKKFNLIKEAISLGFSVDSEEANGNITLSFKTRFYDYLQTPFKQGYTEDSSFDYLKALFKLIELSRFSESDQRDFEMKEQEVRDLVSKLKVKDMESAELFDMIFRNKRNPLFNYDEYREIKRFLISLELILNKYKSKIKDIVSPIFDIPLMLKIGNLNMQLFPHPISTPIQDQVNDLIEQGLKTFIFYGTAGGVKNIPVESIVIPEVIYVYPKSYVRIDPSFYLPIPIENILLEKPSNSYFNTDNFYKTHHVFMSATYQEHMGFLNKLKSLFSKPYELVSIDMDLAPLGELCLEKDVGLGVILYITDVLSGDLQEIDKKGYYVRQIMLSLFRNYNDKNLLINKKEIEDFFSVEFRKIMHQVIQDLIY